MKNVTITLTDEQLARIEVEIATGDFASASEVIGAALHEFFEHPLDGPSEAQILADIADLEARIAAGERLLTVDEVREHLRAALNE